MIRSFILVAIHEVIAVFAVKRRNNDDLTANPLGFNGSLSATFKIEVERTFWKYTVT